MANLINLKTARCTNQKCPLSSSCARFLQMKIDENSKEDFYVFYNKFKYNQETKSCNNYININSLKN